MVFTHTTTGATDRSTIIKGDVGLISGTWQSSGVTSGSIKTGGSVILAHGLTVGSAGVTSGTAKTVLSEKNVNADRTAKNGYIGVTQIDQSNEVTGDWWAFVTV